MSDSISVTSNRSYDVADVPKGPCCGIATILEELKADLDTEGFASNPPIVIYDFAKTYDGTGNAYIVYCIRYKTHELKRRYSEFFSLRNVLCAVHPTVVVPPMPEKQSIADYATKPSKAKQDPSIIEPRKRLLQSFLNRIVRHPILCADHFFHEFLQPSIQWSDTLGSRRFATPKGPGVTLATTLANVITPATSNGQSGVVDPEFAEMELHTKKFEAHVREVMERTHRRVMRRHSDAASEYGELGMVYNGLSLTETSTLSPALDKIGQAYDGMHMSLRKFLKQMETKVSETLHEYTQFGDVVGSVLRYRREKQIQHDQTCELLNNKLHYLNHLEKVENEAKRLEEALVREGYKTGAPSTAGFKGIVGTLSEKLNSVIDSDPESSRKHNIQKTKDVITQLETQRDKQAAEISMITQSVQKEFDRFETEMIQDIRHMLIRYGKLQANLCRENLAAWKEAQAELQRAGD